MSTEIKAQVVVLGAGPAGYSAAFRCADLGLETVFGRALFNSRWSLFKRRLYPF
ncbi:Dihydrolipoyl dehydrogenase [Providencia rustigianii]|nr:Dihydrolipoyl dehydrogenase [Providencia rustigianii]